MRQVLIKTWRILFLPILVKIVKQPEYNGL